MRYLPGQCTDIRIKDARCPATSGVGPCSRLVIVVELDIWRLRSALLDGGSFARSPAAVRQRLQISGCAELDRVAISREGVVERTCERKNPQ